MPIHSLSLNSQTLFDMIQTLLSILTFIAGIVGLTISVIIICKKENFKQNLFLSLCFFSLSISCIYSFYLAQGKLQDYPNVVMSLKSLAFLVAPCAYLYVRNTIFVTKKTRKLDWIHFAPLAISFLYTTVNPSNPIDNNFWFENNLFINVDFYSFNVILTLVWLFYAYTQNLLLLNVENKKEEYLNYNINPQTFRWLKVFSLSIMLLFSTLLLDKITGYAHINMDIVNSVIISTILIGSGILVFFKSSMIFDTKESDFEEEVIAIQEEIHINTADNLRKLSPVIIPEDKMKDYTTVLDKVLADEEPFLKKGFVIRDLSELTDIPIHHLSYLINSKYNLHFQDFVNQKRIEYLKQRVHDKEWRNLSLEGLAWAVGFKSRTTFFRAFIKLTGQSPSEYFNNEKQKRADGFTATA